MIANRNKSTEGSSAVNFEREYDIPTDMALEVSACTVEDDMPARLCQRLHRRGH